MVVVVVCSVTYNSYNAMDYKAHQDPLSMGFPREEYQSGLPLPSPDYLVRTDLTQECLHPSFIFIF